MAFNGQKIGGLHTPNPKLPMPAYYPWAVKNAGKWSLAKPDNTINTTIGNVSLDEKGAPHTESYTPRPSTPPLKPEEKPLTTLQSILIYKI